MEGYLTKVDKQVQIISDVYQKHRLEKFMIFLCANYTKHMDYHYCLFTEESIKFNFERVFGFKSDIISGRIYNVLAD